MPTELTMKDNPEQLAEHYLKRYKRQMQSLEKSPLARVKGLNEYDYIGLGKQLEAFESMQRIMEDDGSVGQLGPLPKVALDVISAVFGISPLPVVAGVQPIDEVQGLVWLKDFVAQNTRGNVTAGMVLSRPDEMPEIFPEDYASDTLIEAEVISDAGTHASYNDVSLGGSDFDIAPIDPNRCVIYGTTYFNSNSDKVTWPQMIADPKTGKFSGSDVVGGTLYSCFGTVDFAHGTMDVQYSATPSSTGNVMNADFAVLEEAATDIQKAILVMRAKSVKARFFALKSTWGFAENYMMQKRWGSSIEADMTRDLAAAVNSEVFNIILKKLIDNIPSGQLITWGREPGSGVSYYEHIMTLPAVISDASAGLASKLGRGSISALIAGIKACAVLEQHPAFSKVFDDDTLGPCSYGTFQGKPVVRVPAPAAIGGMDENQIIGIWKGRNPFEAPVVWAPYMPLTMTETQGTGPNPLQRQKAAAIWGAVESIIPNASFEIAISQTSFDYGSL